jgi:hypothetical protein
VEFNDGHAAASLAQCGYLAIAGSEVHRMSVRLRASPSWLS